MGTIFPFFNPHCFTTLSSITELVLIISGLFIVLGQPLRVLKSFMVYGLNFIQQALIKYIVNIQIYYLNSD